MKPNPEFPLAKPQAWRHLGQRVATHGRRRGRHLAIIDPAEHRTISYAELNQLTSVVAASMRQAGIASGDVAVVRATNSWRFTLFYCASLQLNVVLVPVPRLWGRMELREAITATRASWLVIDSPDEAALEITRDGVAIMDLSTSTPPGEPPYIALSAILANYPPKAAVDPISIHSHSGDPALWATAIHASGVQLALHCHSSADHGLGPCSEAWGLTSDDRIVAAGDVGHLASFQWGIRLALFLGAVQVVMPKWDAEVAAEVVDQHTCTFMYGTGQQLQELLGRRCADTGKTLHKYVLAATQPSVDLVSRAANVGCVVIPSFGLPESFLMTTGRHDDGLAARGMTRGRAVLGTRVAIVDQHGMALEPGVQGEIISYGPHVASCYHQSFSPPSRVLGRHEFQSAEIGTLDEQGYLRWIGSCHALINRGGVLISPREVEDILRRHPLVVDAKVYAMPDAVRGEVVSALLWTRDGFTPDCSEVRQFVVGEGFARLKAPDEVRIVPHQAAWAARNDPAGRAPAGDTEGVSFMPLAGDRTISGDRGIKGKR
jgi:acyl-CoA synthetase (AMP-forming)/AMP-acid ligase II